MYTREKASYITQERCFGSVSRSVTLPTEVNVAKTKAEFEHGMLTFPVPQAEAVKRKSVKTKTR